MTYKTPIGNFATMDFDPEYRVKIYTEVDRGHSAETWADILMDRMFVVLKTAPQPIYEQALQGKNMMKQMFTEALRAAILSDRHTLCVQLEKEGYGDVARAIKRLRGTLID